MMAPQCINAAKSKRKKIRIIQLSDPHLGADPHYRLSGVRTLDSLNDVLASIASNEAATEHFIITGDIAAHGDIREYQLFSQQLSGCDAPFNWLPGNHDEPAVMAEGLGVPFEQSIYIGNWLLLMLNSKQKGAIGGQLGNEQIRQATAVALQHQGPVAVFLHHPPIAVGCAWLDQQKVVDGDDLLENLSQCCNVKAIFSGHVHQEFSALAKGIRINTTPSTCFQFASNSAEFALSSDGPGYRWVDLYDDGHITTGVVQLECNTNHADLCSAGY